MAKTKDNQRKGLHLHRTQPILFGGDPADNENIVLVTRMQHAELSTFWNRKITEMKNQANETTA